MLTVTYKLDSMPHNSERNLHTGNQIELVDNIIELQCDGHELELIRVMFPAITPSSLRVVKFPIPFAQLIAANWNSHTINRKDNR